MPAWTCPATSEGPQAAGAAAAPRLRRLALGRLGAAVHLGCAAPLVLHASRQAGGLAGADPLQVLIHASGFWALALLLATLAVTPLRRFSVWLARTVAVRFGRRISDWNFLIRQRRALGLWSFFYATLHVAMHLGLEAGSLAELLRDAGERPFILFGLGAFLLLVPLAITSTKGWMRRLKRCWACLHLLVYPAAALALVHAWWQTKHGHDLPWGFVSVAGVLLAARVVAWRAGDRAQAAEAPVRVNGPGR